MRVTEAATAFLAITASGFAAAAHVNHDRTGQVVLLPYYTVNNNFITNITITNTTPLFKAVRVRFLESHNSGDVLNFNVYLSPQDVWNGTLRMNSDTGLPNLITEDESCTYPSKSHLQAGVNMHNTFTATTDADLTEGYVEIIEMGVIADGAGPAIDGGWSAEIDSDTTADADGVVLAADIAAGDRSIPAGLLHDAAGMPADCSVVSDAWAAGAVNGFANGFEPGAMAATGVAADPVPALPYGETTNAGLVAPTGGINAYGIMINASTGAAFVQEAVHIDQYTSVAQHYRPDDPVNYRLPSLASGDSQVAHIPNALGDGMKSDTMPLTEYDTGALHNIAPNPSVPMGSNPLPIAVILSADAVSAPYFVEFNVNGETDIVLTFPMRKHGIYNGGTLTNQLDPNEATCAGTLSDGISDGSAVTISSLGAVAYDYPHDGAGNICANAGFVGNENPDVLVMLEYYGYEEQPNVYAYPHETGGPDGFPYPFVSQTDIVLKYGVNVITTDRAFNGNNSVFKTPRERVVHWVLNAGFEAGWSRFNMNSSYNYETNLGIAALTEPVGGLGADVNNTWTGVPVIGFSAMAADAGPAQLGETIELIRHVNRN
ncbi:MAG: hypothetical protein KZQ97_00330 [Candidatus Thiodiazotropha sp. (ex Dulcina madagascariensis)]|nr:hypothetical protein [Candidatus Thiodiazotropha sp. (ex Dulcina madagascariensis)]